MRSSTVLKFTSDLSDLTMGQVSNAVFDITNDVYIPNVMKFRFIVRQIPNRLFEFVS